MNILIVENDAAVSRIWAYWFSRTHTVRVAHTSQEAQKLIDELLPDLVFLDLRLNGPDSSGLEVYSYLRKRLNEDIPIIFITGLEYNVDLFQQAQTIVEHDKEAGLQTSLLKKPVNIKEMTDKIDYAVA